MHWILIALFSPALQAAGNFVDKYLLINERHTGGIGSILIFSSIFGALILPIAWLVEGAQVLQLPFFEISIIMLNGCLAVGTLAAYLYAIEDSDVVSVAPILQTAPIFALATGYVVLGETLNAVELLGSGIAIVSALLLSIEIENGGKGRIRFKNISLAFLSAFFFAMSGSIFKFFALDRGYWVVQFWEYTGIALVGIILYTLRSEYRKSFAGVIRLGRVDVVALIFMVEVIMAVADLTLNYAALFAPLALVYTIGALHPAFVLLIGLFGYVFVPRLMEPLSYMQKHIFLKMAAIALMTVGLIMIHLGSAI